MTAPVIVTPVADLIELDPDELGLLVGVVWIAQYDAEQDARKQAAMGNREAVDFHTDKAERLQSLFSKLGGQA